MPTLATLLRGLVAAWDVEIASVGYANLGGKKFDSTPKWKGDLSLHLPSIIGMVRHPEDLVREFEGTAKRFRRVLPGDFDGDGRRDVAVADEKDERVEFFTDAAAPGDDEERSFADVFFGADKKTWELAEILRWAGDLGARQTARHTGGRPAYASWALRQEAEFSTSTEAGAPCSSSRTTGAASRACLTWCASTSDPRGRGVRPTRAGRVRCARRPPRADRSSK
jgi:hypothetical protein